MRKLAVSMLVALWLASSSSATVPPSAKIFGVMDDGPYACLAASTGFGYIKKTVWVTPGNWHLNQLNQRYLRQLDADMQQAQTCGLKVILEIWPVPEYGPPTGPSQMRGVCDVAVGLARQYPQVTDFEIGLEPNSYQFGGRQFANGVNTSAKRYVNWLGICYDKLKAVNPAISVIGGSLASRGSDNPYQPTSGTSPVLFIQKMCSAYQASGRSRPLMDIFDMHSYPFPTDTDPAAQHPSPSTTITIADYDKLEAVLSCFDFRDSAQPVPPVLWGESGYNTRIPGYLMKGRYTGQKPSSVQPIDEITQGNYIAEEIHMADCQPNSAGFINLHIVDDPSLKKDWQSGLVYAPNRQQRAQSDIYGSYTRKQSWALVNDALTAIAAGTTQCG